MRILAVLGIVLGLALGASAEKPVRVKVDTTEHMLRIDPLVFGVCVMFWEEDDLDMKDGRIAKYLNGMPCRLIRFPGGTEADAYLWESNTLIDKTRWPFEHGFEKMDTNEFMALCRLANAEPLMVVNTELAFFESEEKAIANARKWVAECRDRRWPVKYWEIGNEPYCHTRFTAEEYAKLFVRMAKAMREEDPDIMIAAVGDHDLDRVGLKDMIPLYRLKEAQEAELKFERGNWDLKDEVYWNPANNAKGPKWWPTVVKHAGEEIDVAAIHWYFTPGTDLADMSARMSDVKRFMRKKLPGREVRLAMTEWNVGEWEETGGIRRALDVAEGLCRMIDGGVEMAAFWPLRSSGAHAKKNLLRMDEKTPTENYHALATLSRNALPNRIATKSSTPYVYSFGTMSDRGDAVVLFLINRSGEHDRKAVVDLGEYGAGAAAVSYLGVVTPAPDSAIGRGKAARNPKGEWEVDLPRESMAVVRFRRQ